MKLIFYTHDFYKGGIDTFLVNLLNNDNIYNNFKIEVYTSIAHPSYKKYLNLFKGNIKIKRFFLLDFSEVLFFFNKKFNSLILSKLLLIFKYPLILLNSFFIFFWFIKKKPNIFFFCKWWNSWP